jgi:hypothetical protein
MAASVCLVDEHDRTTGSEGIERRNDPGRLVVGSSAANCGQRGRHCLGPVRYRDIRLPNMWFDFQISR